jgi:hypothetical protein
MSATPHSSGQWCSPSFCVVTESSPSGRKPRFHATNPPVKLRRHTPAHAPRSQSLVEEAAAEAAKHGDRSEALSTLVAMGDDRAGQSGAGGASEGGGRGGGGGCGGGKGPN